MSFSVGADPTPTTGHFGNSTAFEVMKPKGSMGRISTCLIDQNTGDTIEGSVAVGFALQKGDVVAFAGAANVGLTSECVASDAGITLGGTTTMAVDMPTRAAILAKFPDLKYGDRVSFHIFLDNVSDGPGETSPADAVVTFVANDSTSTIFPGAPLNVAAGEGHCAQVIMLFNPTILYGVVVSNQALYEAP